MPGGNELLVAACTVRIPSLAHLGGAHKALVGSGPPTTREHRTTRPLDKASGETVPS